MMPEKLIERIVALEIKQDRIAREVHEIKECVKKLEMLANRGRGGLTAILWAGGFIAALIGVSATVVGFIKGGQWK